MLKLLGVEQHEASGDQALPPGHGRLLLHGPQECLHRPEVRGEESKLFKACMRYFLGEGPSLLPDLTTAEFQSSVGDFIPRDI